MKKIAIFMLAAILLLCLFPSLANCQKNENQKLKWNDTTKVLTRTRFIEVVEVIDTARLYAEKTRLLDEIGKLNEKLDSTNAQIKQARKLITGKKGGGGNKNAPKSADAPPVIIQPTTKPKTTTKPKKDGKN